MKSADYSGKKTHTDLFPCQLATFKDGKLCVVQEKEHPYESRGERQSRGSRQHRYLCWHVDAVSGSRGGQATFVKGFAFPTQASTTRDLAAHLSNVQQYTICLLYVCIKA